MSVPTNSYQRKDITNELEDVRDIVYDVSPELTPVISNAPVGVATNTKHEWNDDRLDDQLLTNAWLDGQVFAGQTITPPRRITNECQISRKDIIVTRRARKLSKAGPDDELARQVVRKGRELKRDMEGIVQLNQGSVVDTDGATVPLLAGIPTYIIGLGDGRADRGATGTDPAALGSAKGDGTKRAMSEAAYLGVFQAIYTQSDEAPNVLCLDVKSKANFSQYMFGSSARIATQYQDQGTNPRGGVQVVGAVDVWVTDYNVVDIVPDRFIPPRWDETTPQPAVAGGYDHFIYNTSMIDIAYFDSISTDAMAKVADTDDRMIFADYTVVPRAPYSLGTVADIDETLAMVA
jgi:hypothetical protein